jgi:probable HAF family extracellular repeat protein
LATFAGGAGVETAFAQVGNIARIEIPGASSSWAQAINNSGQIVGIYLVTGGPCGPGCVTSHAYLRTPTGTITFIEDPAPAIDPDGAINLRKIKPTDIYPDGINDTGQIVGHFLDHDGKTHGFLRAPEGAFTTIDVPGATVSYANGINNAGQIVGNFTDANGNSHGYLRTSAGTFTTFDAPGATDTSGLGINNAGQIVGQFGDAGGKTHGYLRTAGGAFTTIAVPGATNTGVTGINDAGQIVGWFGDAGAGHGYLNTGGTFTTINPPGATGTDVNGINNAGQIVGEFSVPGGSELHGYIMALSPAR